MSEVNTSAFAFREAEPFVEDNHLAVNNHSAGRARSSQATHVVRESIPSPRILHISTACGQELFGDFVTSVVKDNFHL